MIWGGGDTTIPSPGRSPKQLLPGIGLHDPLHGRQACPESSSFHHGIGQISSLEEPSSCRLLPKRGQICDIPAPPIVERLEALSLTIGCSARHWLDRFARVAPSSLLKIHGPSDRELADKTAAIRMHITTEAEALFDKYPQLKNKALLLDITIVNPYAGSNLGNAARHIGKHLADAVERKKNKYRGAFPATYSPLPLAMSTCGDVGSDVHALIKELAIRRVEHRRETHSNESHHLAEGTEVARFRWRFYFVLQHSLSFRTRHHLCRQGVALESTRQLGLQGPESVQAHRTEGVTGSEEQEGANGVGSGIGVGAGTETVPGSGVGTGTGTEQEGGRRWR